MPIARLPTNQINTSDVVLSPSFQTVNDLLKRFSLTCFHDPKRVEEYVDLFSLRALCKELEADRMAEQKLCARKICVGV